MSSFWLLACNGTKARFFAGDGPTAPLEEVECMVNTAGARHERDLATDRAGRYSDGGQGHKSAMNETHYKEQSVEEFARRIADFLQHEREAQKFAQLSVIAAPSVLGHLRANLHKTVQDTILEELDKDVTAQSPREIQEHLTRLAR